MNGHGGARDNSGRKKKLDKYKEPIARAEDKIADKLPEIAEKLLEEALEGFQLTRETYEPAAIVMIDDVETTIGENGTQIVKVKRLAFPDLDPYELVLVKRVLIQTAPGRDAAKYLFNRIAGSPVQQIEADIAAKQLLPDALEAAMLEAYGPDDDSDELDDFEDESDADPQD